MKAHYLLPALFVVAACDVPNSPSRAASNGSTEIKLQEGQNCWDNQCMRYDPRNGSFTLPGRYSVGAISGSIQNGGYISVSAYQQNFSRAINAGFNGREFR